MNYINGLTILILPLLLGGGQNHSSTPPKMISIDYGQPSVRRTQKFHDKYKNPQSWVSKPIDWRDQSGKAEWEKVSRDFMGHRYDFEKYKGYVDRYKKTKSKHDALRLAIAYLVIGSPDDKELSTYQNGSGDLDFGATEYTIFRQSLGSELSPIEAKVLLLMDCSMTWNPQEWVDRYHLFEKKGMIDDRLTRTVGTRVFQWYLDFRSKGQYVEEFAKRVDAIYKKTPSIRSRNAFAGSRIALGKFRKDVKVFDLGCSLHKVNNDLMLKSTSDYDYWFARRKASEMERTIKMRDDWFKR